MMRYMLDTDTSSYIIRKAPVSVVQRLERTASSGHEIVVSVITYAELMQGVVAQGREPERVQRLQAFLAPLHAVLPWDRYAADAWAQVYTALKEAGTPIGSQDTMIAAHALSAGAVVVTNNVKHFCRVEGLRVENWVDPVS
ncbi:MAG: type II toxin-antitoxin system VapC family toxin [Phycisphaeraceae bacterium]